MHGCGIYIDENGDIKAGQFQKGERHGFQREIFYGQSYYVGQYNDGVRVSSREYDLQGNFIKQWK